jgi:hypothetical protein
MVSKPNMNPDNTPIKGPTPSPADAETPSKTWTPKPLTWLGMSFDAQQTKQLWSTISQSIGQAIQKDKERAVEAIKKLGKSTDPDNDDDS